MCQRLIYTILHVATQITRKFLPVISEDKPLQDNHARDDFYEWSQEDWLSFFKGSIKDLHGIFPWFENFQKNNFGSLDHLAWAISSHLESVQKNRGHYILICDRTYPKQLLHITHPPVAITTLGDPNLLSRRCVSVVGSRRASPDAIEESYQVGRAVGQEGWTVVSGGAFGCDISAHLGALSVTKSFCPTVAVMAGGLENLYPRGNQNTLEKMIHYGGAIISERLWWEKPKPYDFPIRNRIISGLSDVLVLVQGGDPSGAMITAQMALDQGRDVYVFDSPHKKVFEGNMRLVSEGAPVYTGADELIALISSS